MKPVYLVRRTAAAAIVSTLAIMSTRAEEQPVADEPSIENVADKVAAAVDAQEKTLTSTPEVPPETEDVSAKVSLTEDDGKKDKKLSPRDLALKDHREQLKIYDLDENGSISEEEWKAANEKNPDRNEKFNLVDKDKDGQINDDEAMEFLLQRLSVESTFVGESDDNGTESIIEDGIEENAPSELRFTLFSIPIGD